MLHLFLGEGVANCQQPVRLGRVFGFGIEELLGRNAQIVTYHKKHGHRWVVLTILNVVDIRFSLTEGEAHIPRRKASLNPQFRQSLREFPLLHTVKSPLYDFTISKSRLFAFCEDRYIDIYCKTGYYRRKICLNCMKQ